MEQKADKRGYGRLVLRACLGLLLGVCAVAAVSQGLVTYSAAEEPRARIRAQAVVFPADTVALDATMRHLLAEQGAALDQIEPAAGAAPSPHPLP